MIKKISCYKWIALAIFIAIMTPIYSHAQNSPDSTQVKEKRVHFGYGVGFNVMGLSMTGNPDYTVTMTPYTGINLHMGVNIFLNQRFDLMIHAGILLNERDIYVQSLATQTEETFKVESDILELPIALKFKFLPRKNRTPYCLIGFSPKFDLGRNELLPLLPNIWMHNGRWRIPSPLLRDLDLYPEIGIGSDYQLKKLKLGVELKFSLGLLDVNIKPKELGYDLYASGIKSSYSRLFILCFNFE